MALFLDIGLLVGVIGYGAYLVSLLIQGQGRNIGEGADLYCRANQSLGSVALSSLGGTKRSLAFQRIGRRV